MLITIPVNQGHEYARLACRNIAPGKGKCGEEHVKAYISQKA